MGICRARCCPRDGSAQRMGTPRGVLPEEGHVCLACVRPVGSSTEERELLGVGGAELRYSKGRTMGGWCTAGRGQKGRSRVHRLRQQSVPRRMVQLPCAGNCNVRQDQPAFG